MGATSAIAHQCARLWLAAGGVDRLVLIGRDGARLPSVAADLQVRQPGTRIEAIAADMLQPEAIAGTVRGVCADGVPDLVLIAHGNLPDQPACEADLAAARQALEVNGLSPRSGPRPSPARSNPGGADASASSARWPATAAASPTTSTARRKAWWSATPRACSTGSRARGSA